jgi:hypothetical protein
MKYGILIGAVALAAAIILGLSFYWRSGSEPPAPEPTVEVPMPVPAPAPDVRVDPIAETPPSPVVEAPIVPEVILPPLNESDAFVLERLADSALPPAWLEREDLVRRAAVVVENAGRGQIPRRQLAFMAPQGKYPVRTEGERIFVDPAGYERYDRYLVMLESVPAADLAGILTDGYPLFDEALAELGTRESLLPQVLSAIDQVLAVPVLEGEVELVQPKVFYEYADPALEELSPLQKQVLRMGPDNVVRLKNYLTELRQALLRG